jgi:hypothetical protein
MLKAGVLEVKEPSVLTEPTSAISSDDQQKAASVESQEQPLAPTSAEQNAPKPPEVPAPQPPPALVAKTGQKPQRLMSLFVPKYHLARVFRQWRGNVPSEIDVVACEMDRTEPGVLFTLRSPAFPLVAPGEPIEELRPKFASGR